MEDGRQHQNGRYKVDNYYSVAHGLWGMMAPHQVKEQPNALVMNKMAMEKRMMAICAERDAIIEEQNMALAEKKEALAERDEAIRQQEKAIVEQDKALMERDKAYAAIQYCENAINFPSGNGNQLGSKRAVYHSDEMAEALDSEEMPITDALPITTVSPKAAKSRQAKRSKENKAALVRATKSPRKGNGVGKDLNGQCTTNGKKFRSDWDNQDIGLNLVSFDESTMPAPICTCTENPHQCYKWGNGGWQSACCTITMSSYPLPHMPNKRHARVGGRKMSGSVFTELLSRLAAEGYDLSLPLDLKEYWARHGTNRYITIK